MVTDPIADLLTRIRNACMSRRDHVDVPKSKLVLEITRILEQEGFVSGYQVIPDRRQGMVRIGLRYEDRRRLKGTISGVKRVSKPGLRVYAKADDLPRVLRGVGMAIISTSQGLLTDREARKRHVGGEVLCHVW
jgi:small subunit ribosomal protein S8